MAVSKQTLKQSTSTGHKRFSVGFDWGQWGVCLQTNPENAQKMTKYRRSCDKGATRSVFSKCIDVANNISMHRKSKV